MAETTGISWCHHTFNPWIGCTKVSVGPCGACEGCYAEVATPSRALGVKWGNEPRHRTSPSYWKQPLAWDRKAAAAGERRFVFCASLADVFDNQVDPQWRCELFDLIRATPHLTWLLLTKRPQNIVKLFRETILDVGDADHPECFWPDNAAILCTIVTQPEADRDLPHLLLAQAALRPPFTGVSMEPLMGHVDIAWALSANRVVVGAGVLRRGYFDPGLEKPMRLNWVITGGETDQGAHKARPSHPDWFRSLRDQCAAAGVPYHHKQNGEWWFDHRLPKIEWAEGSGPPCVAWPDGTVADGTAEQHGGLGIMLTKWGKKATGRELDGVTHYAMPEAARG